MNSKQLSGSIRQLITLLSLLPLVSGCGAGGMSVPSTAPVKGVVKLKGKPARGIRVKFHHHDGAPTLGFVPVGDTGPDGSFTMSTGAPQNGAPPGKYLVTFERPILDPKKSVETEIDALGGKYSDPTKSKWTATVTSGENILEPFELE